MLLYSQAATAKAIVPVIVTALGISATNPQDSYMLVACFAAVSALFVLPTYPTLLGAVQMDDTGTTRIGKIYLQSLFLYTRSFSYRNRCSFRLCNRSYVNVIALFWAIINFMIY